MGLYKRSTRLHKIKKGKQENELNEIAIYWMEYHLLGWCRSGVGVGVVVAIFGSESESEPIKNRRSAVLPVTSY